MKLIIAAVALAAMMTPALAHNVNCGPKARYDMMMTKYKETPRVVIPNDDGKFVFILSRNPDTGSWTAAIRVSRGVCVVASGKGDMTVHKPRKPGDPS